MSTVTTELPALHEAAQEHAMYRIANTPVRDYPYPHIYVDSVFPSDFYAEMRRHWPSAGQLVSLGETGRVPQGKYAERFVMPLADLPRTLPAEKHAFWATVASWLLQAGFANAMLQKFEPYMRQRFGAALEQVRFDAEAQLVRDHARFSLGPHTDAPHKVLSMLFYCPDDNSMKHLGTSIYAPIDPKFRCAGGPHHPFEAFAKVITMEYAPNALFAFFKNDRSFHAVDPITDSDVQRDLLLYDIRAVV